MLTQFRVALRTLRRTPVYATVTTLTLALGIGATTGVLSIVDTVLLRALPYRDVGRLAMVIEQSGPENFRTPSYPAFQDLLSAVGGPVEGLGFVRGGQPILSTGKGSERALTGWVTPGFFALMGGSAMLGRTFTADDERSSANSVAVLSFNGWQRLFDGDPAIVGRTVRLDSVPTIIVGVMPRGFTSPFSAQLWVPIAQIAQSEAALGRREVHVDSRTIVRIRSDQDSARAAAALSVVTARLASAYPEEAGHFTRVALRPVSAELIGDIRSTLTLLSGAALLVLLLSCVNVATLSLVRASAMSRELAVRTALGATRRRLLSGLLGESAILMILGAGAGTALAMAIVQIVKQRVAGNLPRADELAVDGRALAIGIGVSVVAALLAGLAPAWRASGMAPAVRLHGGLRGAAGTRSDSRIRSGLIALQFSFAIMLLVCAGLLIQSFRKLQQVPDGYDVKQIASVAIGPPSNYAHPKDALALYDRLRDAIAQVPGVQSVALVNHPPGGASVVSQLDIPGRPTDASSDRMIIYRTASSEYARTMGMGMAQGRWFSASDMRIPDDAGFVVNETFAKRFWPAGSAVGQVITLHRASPGRPDIGQPISGAIIGVVRDVHSFGRDALPAAEAFVPYTREVWPWITVVARASEPARVATGIRKAIMNTEPNIPVSARNTSGGVEFSTPGGPLSRREMALTMVTAFAGAALLLAAIGLYGVVAYGVTQRTRELGIRMALGATRANIVKLVLKGAIQLVALGTIVGLGAAFAGARLLRSVLFETSPTDAPTYVVAPAVLAIVALIASGIPAGRAAEVEPTVAMRGE